MSVLVNGTESDTDLIHWEHNDPDNLFNFPSSRKIMICAIVCVETSWVAMCSSIAAPIAYKLVDEFGVSSVESRLPVAMFLFGMSIGPVILTPFAEDFGRKKVITICLLVIYLFQIPCALARNLTTIAVSRLVCGIAGSPVFNSLANIPNLWQGDDVAGLWAMNAWAYSAEIIVLLIKPSALAAISSHIFVLFQGPVIASYINAHMSWRWVYGIWGIVGCGLIVPYTILVPEARGGVILTTRAQRARKAGRVDTWAIHEKAGRRSAKQILRDIVFRPVVMLCTEPIVYCFALCDGLNYGIYYVAIEAVPLIYAQYGLTEPNINLMFFAFQIGVTLAIPIFSSSGKRHCGWRRKRAEKMCRSINCFGHSSVNIVAYIAAYIQVHGWSIILAALLFPISMFWIAWTCRPPINIYVSLCGFAGFAISGHIIFLAVSDYTVESYGLMASSAITAQSFAREPICGILSLVVVQFYQNVGYRWASTILGILSAVMGVFPFVFYKFGPQIRQKSRYAQDLAQLEREERQRLKFIEMQATKNASNHGHTT